MHQCIILQVVRSRAVPQVSLQEARNLSPTIVYGLLHSQQTWSDTVPLAVSIGENNGLEYIG